MRGRKRSWMKKRFIESVLVWFKIIDIIGISRLYAPQKHFSLWREQALSLCSMDGGQRQPY